MNSQNENYVILIENFLVIGLISLNLASKYNNRQPIEIVTAIKDLKLELCASFTSHHIKIIEMEVLKAI